MDITAITAAPIVHTIHGLPRQFGTLTMREVGALARKAGDKDMGLGDIYAWGHKPDGVLEVIAACARKHDPVVTAAMVDGWGRPMELAKLAGELLDEIFGIRKDAPTPDPQTAGSENPAT
jgi:hypothetical protein